MKYLLTIVLSLGLVSPALGQENAKQAYELNGVIIDGTVGGFPILDIDEDLPEIEHDRVMALFTNSWGPEFARTQDQYKKCKVDKKFEKKIKEFVLSFEGQRGTIYAEGFINLPKIKNQKNTHTIAQGKFILEDGRDFEELLVNDGFAVRELEDAPDEFWKKPSCVKR